MDTDTALARVVAVSPTAGLLTTPYRSPRPTGKVSGGISTAC
ncbi:hypothetical protein ACFIQG_19390 [Comamonas odontotermitis]